MKKSKIQIVCIAPPSFGTQQACRPEEVSIQAGEVAGHCVTPGIVQGLYTPHISITNCTFDHVTFRECSFKGAQLTDVRFDHCDLSNVSFDDAGFSRTEFVGCKLLGAGFAGTTLNHTLLQGCNCQYINLSESRLRTCRFEGCDLRFGMLAQCKLQLAVFDRCGLMETDFSHTPLTGIDLRTSQIGGIRINPPDLRGAVIAASQSLDLVPLLGVIIEE